MILEGVHLKPDNEIIREWENAGGVAIEMECVPYKIAEAISK